MTARQPRLDVSGRSRGFAIVIVLWAFVLIGVIVIHVTAAGRTELRIAGNVAVNAAAQAAADGAIYQAIFHLIDPRPDERWRLDGSTHELHVNNSRVTLKLENEAARINPNVAPPALLKALLGASSSDPEQAAALALAIADWTGASTGPRPLTGINTELRAAGYDPPGAPLESIEELGHVRGMTPSLVESLRPHLTLFGPAIPDVAGADPVVVRAVAEAEIVSDPSPALAIADPSGVLTARISATAHGTGNAVANRIAIARIGPRLPHGYALLAWESNAD